jgi:hypothetical protein
MSKMMLLVVLLSVLAVSGCKTYSGSREYIPGEGWKQVPD